MAREDRNKEEGWKFRQERRELRNETRFDDSIGIYPEFVDGYGVLILPTTGATCTSPIARCCRAA